jgi:hypothetical protein
MLWLQPIPWARWATAAAIAAIALWVELAPAPMTQHPFALVDIPRGEVLSAANTELRPVPAGLLDSPGPGAVAIRDIAAGAPLLSGDAGNPGRIIPQGWWVVATEVPPGALRGDPVRIVLLDGGGVVDGVVASAETGDPFETGIGSVAVPPDGAHEVARGAAEGRLVVLVGTG